MINSPFLIGSVACNPNPRFPVYVDTIEKTPHGVVSHANAENVRDVATEPRLELTQKTLYGF
jgi:hypothetical protein